jgi:ankyrin repeat protein
MFAALISRSPSLSKAMTVLVLAALGFLVTGSETLAAQQFQPPPGALLAGFRETAAHRPALPPLRLSRHHDTQEDLGVWLHIDTEGRVLDVHTIGKSEVNPAELLNAARNLRYAPFVRNGVPMEAWAQDSFSLIEIEGQPARAVPFPKISDRSAVAIRLSRSGCYGFCPAYSVTIHGDGSVVYAGNRFVSIAGTHDARISAADFAALLERFRKANFFALNENYASAVTDNPRYYLSISLPGRTKIVWDYVGGRVGMPAVIAELEDAVDRAADSARWVTSSSGTVAAMRQAGIAMNSPQAAKILRAAVHAGDVVTVRALLAAGTSASDPRDSSLLELAADSDNAAKQLEMLQLLLATPAVSADQTGKQRALARAVQHGEVDLARALIAGGADPSARFASEYEDAEQNETYLTLAASSGVWAMLDDALARPHDIHAVDGQGRTALVSMVLDAPPGEEIFPLMDRLLAAGADHTDLDRVLLETCQPNWIPGLVARGGNINARDANGNTPLFQSCAAEGVQAMLDAGADPSVQNIDGETAIEVAYPTEDGKEDPRAVLIRRFLENRPRPR